MSSRHSYSTRSTPDLYNYESRPKKKSPEKKKATRKVRSSKRSTATGMSRSQFLLGDMIMLHGTKKASFNGVYGEVTGPYSTSKGRWPVTIFDINGKERTVNVKTDNLQLVEEFGPGDFEQGDMVQIIGTK